jgi:transcriptional regulator with XRE-family HTH domain
MKKSPSDADRHVGARIRSRRIALGISQEKLGAALGLTFQQIQKYEKGTNRIGAGRLQNIGGVVGVTASYFFEGLPAGEALVEDKISNLDAILAMPEGARLVRACTAVTNPILQRKIVDFVEAALQLASKVKPR